ncbi:mechanosensitive ion channel protein [Rhizobium sp. Leaf384]|uniref:mechanosensitive ion channel family protein n=1 Tax=unclassified Rhizobium TaxID=2613769 RepID=UPI00071339F7|nr:MULTISPECIES: mechanosensitive ion channel domain-containing protein [unclassified Rhizobium]KQS79318.1 mechanosensitive ion channel protein [Rhizobium sp. Leaf384]KQS82886.1 mechanosensitive ion channel protein [Rhizobium sp. Leaf383]
MPRLFVLLLLLVANLSPVLAQQPAASSPSANQPVATQPAASQPAATQPAATQPAATQPAAAPSAAQPGSGQQGSGQQGSGNGASERDRTDEGQTDATQKLDAARKRLDTLAAQVDNTNAAETGRSTQANNANAADNRLAEIKAQVDDLSQQVAGQLDAARTRIEQIKGRLTEIGDPPAAGAEPEASVVTEERSRLVSERNALNAVTGTGETLVADANALSTSITEKRRVLFSNTLLRHTDINLDMLVDAGQALVVEGRAFSRNIGSWLTFVFTFKRVPLMWALLLSLCSALVLLAGTHRLFAPLLRRSVRDLHPTYIARLSRAFGSTLVPTIASATFATTAFFFLQSFNVLRQDIAPVVVTFLALCVALQFVWTISTAVLAPGQAVWRLVRVSDRGARLLVALIMAMAFANLLDYLLETISVTLGSPLVLTVAKSLIASIIIGLLLMAVALIRPVIPQGEPLDGQGRPWPRAISILLLLAGLGLITAALSGYVGLARFIATQIVVTGAIFVTMYIGILTGKALAKQNALAKTVGGRYLSHRYRLEPMALDQIGLAVGLGIYLLVAMFFVPLLLLQWGFKIADIEAWAYRIFTEIRIGTITISLVGIFAGILLFVLGFVVTRWLQRWIDGSVLARSRVDLGVRNSVKTGIGYLGMGIAGLIGISAAGLDLSSLALVAGALSLGVGFGLQNIVSNFVSGLILLVERPFKVGDWVISGTTEGFVKRISVRATEVETFQRQTIMVPNSLFINASVGNWTHRNKLGRVDITFTAHSSNDPRKVVESLRAAVTGLPNILRNPEPIIVFRGFTAAELDFEVRVFLADILQGVSVRTDVRMAVFERFKADGIALGGPAAPEVPIKISPEDAEVLSALFQGTRSAGGRASSQLPGDAGGYVEQPGAEPPDSRSDDVPDSSESGRTDALRGEELRADARLSAPPPAPAVPPASSPTPASPARTGDVADGGPATNPEPGATGLRKRRPGRTR